MSTELQAIERKGRKAIEKANVVLEHLAVKYVPIESIRENEWNPNRQSDHDFQLLLKSITENGFTQPIVVQQGEDRIVDGAHRWRAAKQLGFKEIPVVYVDWTEAQQKLATLTHNRARGSEDIELVAAMLRDIEKIGAIDWAKDSLMLSQVELDRLLEDVSAPEALAAPEYSTAWVPEGTHHATEAGNERAIGGAQAIEGITASASDRQRAAEKALVAAKSEEERQAVMRDRDIHRVALTFDGAEAAIVREALGDRPAEELLRMCRQKLGIATE